MIELRHTVDINVSPETVWRWLETLPDHINMWHPDHISARWIEGGGFEPGAVMEVRERLHGKAHRLRISLTEAVAGRIVRYRFFPGCRGSFELEEIATGTKFTAAVEIGIRIPIVAPLLDKLLGLAIPGRLNAIRRHQAEEGENLKILLENGTTGERVS